MVVNNRRSFFMLCLAVAFGTWLAPVSQVFPEEPDNIIPAQPTRTGEAARTATGPKALTPRIARLVSLPPWYLRPAKFAPGMVGDITISGGKFRAGGEVPRISVPGQGPITFSDVRVLDEHTVVATISIPASAKRKNYAVRIDTPGDDPSTVALRYSCKCLTVADPDPAADLVDISSAIGIPAFEGFTAGILVDDLNDDSLDDILPLRHGRTVEFLLLGNGKSVSLREVMEVADRHECDSADVNGDGRTDIYCSVGAEEGGGTGPNNLWLQQADGSFVDEAESWGVTDPYGRGRDVVFLHANNDEYPDLFVSNWGPRSDNKASVNRLFINRSGTSFAPAPEYGVDGGPPSRCAKVADYDGDGDDDLLVCGSDRVRMYANQAGEKFVDVAPANGFPQQFMDAAFADIDDDGDLDIAFVTGTGFEIHRLDKGVDGGVAFSQAAPRGKSVAFGDINGDSRPDAYFVRRGCSNPGEPNLPDILAVNVNGESFNVLHPPDISRGCGDAVAAFDHDGDGTDGFLVGNGRGRTGPLQYLVLPRTD